MNKIRKSRLEEQIFIDKNEGILETLLELISEQTEEICLLELGIQEEN